MTIIKVLPTTVTLTKGNYMNHLFTCEICNNPTEEIDINIVYQDYTFENYFCGVCWGGYIMVTEGLGKSLAGTP